MALFVSSTGKFRWSYLVKMFGQKGAEPQIMEVIDRAGALEEPHLLATARTPEVWAGRLTKAGRLIAAATIRDEPRVSGYC